VSAARQLHITRGNRPNRTAASNTIEAHIARLRPELGASTAEIQRSRVRLPNGGTLKTSSTRAPPAAGSPCGDSHWNGGGSARQFRQSVLLGRLTRKIRHRFNKVNRRPRVAKGGDIARKVSTGIQRRPTPMHVADLRLARRCRWWAHALAMVRRDARDDGGRPACGRRRWTFDLSIRAVRFKRVARRGREPPPTWRAWFRHSWTLSSRPAACWLVLCISPASRRHARVLAR